MTKTIAVLKGDGVGPEIIDQAIRVLEVIAKKSGTTFSYTQGLIGAQAYKKTGEMLPGMTLMQCRKADAVLLGAIGDPEFDHLRPETALLTLRKQLGLYCNIRPVYAFPKLTQLSPIKDEVIFGTDFIIIRELTGGIYFGKRGKTKTSAYDTLSYTVKEIERIAIIAFEQALNRRKKVTLVDKANVLDTSRLWREVVTHIAKAYPEVVLEYMYVDNAAMQIIKHPTNFDVLLTENMFGDILSDEASVITGSLGMLPSASIGEKYAMFEPIHGSFPKAAGTNSANPTGTILAAAMMLDIAFGMKKERDMVYEAVVAVLQKGIGTKDVAPRQVVSMSAFTDSVCKQIR